MSRSKHSPPESVSSRGHSRPRSSSNTTSKPQLFPLAHPPPKSGKSKAHQSLRLSSRLLLQIQQSSASRAIPILELYQPSTFGKSILQKDGAARKVHGKDFYLTQSEIYTHLRERRGGNGFGNGNGHEHGHGNGYLRPDGPYTKPRSGSGASTHSASGASARRKSRSSEYNSSSGEDNERKSRLRPRRKSQAEASGDEDDIVAVIHTSPKSRPKCKTKSTSKESTEEATAELFFPLTNQTWEATTSAGGPKCYRFTLQLDETQGSSTNAVFNWESRPPSRSSAENGSKDPADTDRFVLSVSVDDGGGCQTTSSRNAWLAQLSRQGFTVGALEEPAMRALVQCGGDSDDAGGLYTLVLAMGVYVAREEGWIVY